MRPFSDLNQEFSEWILKNNVSFDHKERIKYIWEIPENAINQWKTELEDYKDLFSEDTYQNYLKQFEPGGTLLGIYNVVLDDSDTVKLYKLTSVFKEFSVNRILVSKNIQLPIEPNLITLPDGKSFNLPTSIEHETLTISIPEGSIDLIDSPNNVQRGTLAGKEFIDLIRDENKLNSNSLLATIDYQSGMLHIIRNNDSNEKLFVKYYEWLLEEIEHSSSHVCKTSVTTTSTSSSSSSNSSHTETTYTPFYSIHPASQVVPYNYLSVSGSFYSLGAPLELVFEFDCINKPEIQPDEEYISLVNYSSQQEVIIQQIKESVNNALVAQQDIINNYTGNFDFQLGTTVS